MEHDDTSTNKKLKLTATTYNNKKIGIFAITRQFYSNEPYVAIVAIGKSRNDSYPIACSTIVANSGISISSSSVDNYSIEVFVAKGNGNAMGQLKIIELYNEGILTSVQWVGA